MTRFKKLLAIVLAMVLMLSMSVSAFASPQNPNVRVINRSEHISKQAIQEIAASVTASFVYEDGTSVPVESVITITDVDTTSKSRNGNDGNTYRIDSESKVSSKSNDKNNNGVVASIFLSLWWTDVLGTDNTFDSLEGSIDVTEGELMSSTYIYGTRGLSGSYTEIENGTETSFYEDIGMISWSPDATYSAGFRDGKGLLTVRVNPTIID